MGCATSKSKIVCDICLEHKNPCCYKDYIELECGHTFHASCFSKHLIYRKPTGYTSLGVHNTRLSCPACHHLPINIIPYWDYIIRILKK